MKASLIKISFAALLAASSFPAFATEQQQTACAPDDQIQYEDNEGETDAAVLQTSVELETSLVEPTEATHELLLRYGAFKDGNRNSTQRRMCGGEI